jgi:hypothetical protein
MEWIRLPNETDDELIYRIGGLKDEIGTWEDVAEILNELTGYNYGESAYRKRYTTFEKMFDANKNRIISSDEYSQSLYEREASLKKERIKLQAVNSEHNKVLRTEARRELFYENIGKYIQTLPLPEYEQIQEGDANTSDSEFILTIADIHYGAVFESVNNMYSPDICAERFELLTKKMIEFIKVHKVRKLRIIDLGDDIQGCLRMSDLKLNDSSVVKAVVEVSRLIAKFLNDLSVYTEIDYYHVPTSNHTQLRMIGMKPNECGDEDVEYIISSYIADMLRFNERITTHVNDDAITYGQYIVFSVADGTITIGAGHGHLIKNSSTALQDVSNLIGINLEYLMLGHLHCGKIYTVGETSECDLEVIYSPSIIGSDPYSDRLMVGAKASACVYEFEPWVGHTNTYKIILNNL